MTGLLLLTLPVSSTTLQLSSVLRSLLAEWDELCPAYEASLGRRSIAV
jgi:hypothetical protein